MQSYFPIFTKRNNIIMFGLRLTRNGRTMELGEPNVDVKAPYVCEAEQGTDVKRNSLLLIGLNSQVRKPHAGSGEFTMTGLVVKEEGREGRRKKTKRKRKSIRGKEIPRDMAVEPRVTM